MTCGNILFELICQIEYLTIRKKEKIFFSDLSCSSRKKKKKKTKKKNKNG